MQHHWRNEVLHRVPVPIHVHHHENVGDTPEVAAAVVIAAAPAAVIVHVRVIVGVVDVPARTPLRIVVGDDVVHVADVLHAPVHPIAVHAPVRHVAHVHDHVHTRVRALCAEDVNRLTVDAIIRELLVEVLDPHHQHVMLTPSQVSHGKGVAEVEQRAVVHLEIVYGDAKMQSKAESRMDVGYTTNMREVVKQAKSMMGHP